MTDRDIVERLRDGRTNGSNLRWTVTPIHIEAADEITRLREDIRIAKAEIERLRGLVASVQDGGKHG